MITPTLILIAGPPGCGKSTLGKEMARTLNACLVDLDTVSSQFVQPYLENNPSFKDTAEYQSSFRDREYTATLKIAAENLAIGMSCVCVAPFRKEVQDEEFGSRLQAMVGTACRMVAVSVVINDHDLYFNLSRRKLARDQRKLDHFDNFASHAVEPYRDPQWNIHETLTVEFARGEEWITAVIASVAERMQAQSAPGSGVD